MLSLILCNFDLRFLFEIPLSEILHELEANLFARRTISEVEVVLRTSSGSSLSVDNASESSRAILRMSTEAIRYTAIGGMSAIVPKFRKSFGIVRSCAEVSELSAPNALKFRKHSHSTEKNVRSCAKVSEVLRN